MCAGPGLLCVFLLSTLLRTTFTSAEHRPVRDKTSLMLVNGILPEVFSSILDSTGSRFNQVGACMSWPEGDPAIALSSGSTHHGTLESQPIPLKSP